MALDDVFRRSIKNDDGNNDDGKDAIFHLSYLRIYCDTIQDLLLEQDKEDCAGDGKEEPSFQATLSVKETNAMTFAHESTSKTKRLVDRSRPARTLRRNSPLWSGRTRS